MRISRPERGSSDPSQIYVYPFIIYLSIYIFIHLSFISIYPSIYQLVNQPSIIQDSVNLESWGDLVLCLGVPTEAVILAFQRNLPQPDHVITELYRHFILFAKC